MEDHSIATILFESEKGYNVSKGGYPHRGFANLYLAYVQSSQPGENKYVPNPKSVGVGDIEA